MLITNMAAGVGAGATVDIQPPADQEWLVREVGNSVPFVGAVPDVQIALADAVHNDAIMIRDPAIDASRRYRAFWFYITNTTFLRVTNTGGAGANLSWYGERVRAGLTISEIRNIGVGATIQIQPPAGQTWEVCYFGASVWTGAGDRNPDVSIGITDGTLVASNILLPTMNRGQDKPLNWIIDNATFLRVTDTSGGGLDFGFVGRRVPLNSIGAVQDIGAGGTLDIQPAAGQEFVITEFGAEVWAGTGAPNDKPDVTISMVVGANLSQILEAGSISNSAIWSRELILHIDNAHYLRATNVNAANNEFGFLGYLRRTYS
jgi:hypothetical protein